MTKKQKLELTWVGKENRPRLEPRVLVADEGLSHHAGVRRGAGDIFDNMLIHGDNLLALKALEAEYAGQVKCVYIDPPYNTGSAFEHYDDGLEHSIWLGLMRDRLEIIRRLLREDGLLFVQIDDNEVAYLTVMLDELFGRDSRVNTIAVKMSEASGVKMAHTDRRLPKLKEYILVYRKTITPPLRTELIPVAEWNEEYKTILLGIERDEVEKIKALCANESAGEHDSAACNRLLARAYTMTLQQYFKESRIKKEDYQSFKFDNAWRIVQAVGSSSVLSMAKRLPRQQQEISAGLSARGLIYLYKSNFDHLAKQPRIQIIFADQNLFRNPGDFWTDIKTTGGVGQEGGVLFPNGKKPEALVRRLISMCTNPGDLVLDSFAGSGTTGAVAHKMGRRWIMVELGEHAHTHIVPRLRKVIDGEDPGGVTKATGWAGGGGYRYYRLAPSLMEKDRWGREVISPAYNAAMLAEALCKLEGFTYAPNPDVWWQHGRSTDTDWLYVTTQTLGPRELAHLSEEVGDGRTLLVLCAAWVGDARAFENLTLRKIPNHVRDKCEWGKDDYSLNVANLPMAADAPGLTATVAPDDDAAPSAPPKRGRPPKAPHPTLFDDAGEGEP
jgi:adenine-specific DNA-methyltransferase